MDFTPSGAFYAHFTHHAVGTAVDDDRNDRPPSRVAPLQCAPSTLAVTAPVSIREPPPCDRRTLELIRFFFSTTAPRLVFFTETVSVGGSGGGGDWARLILPLTYGCEPLRNAVCSIASAYLETMGTVSGRMFLDFHNMALDGLSQQTGSLAHVPTSLATILLLIHYEAIIGKKMTNVLSHIQAAHHLLTLQRDNDNEVMRFLEKVFHLYDVSIALSQGTEPMAQSFQSKRSQHDIAQTKLLPGQTQPLDSVFGLALDLWPTLHRLARLRSLTGELQLAIESRETLKIAVLKAEHQAATTAIGTALEKWHPLPSGMSVYFPDLDIDSQFSIGSRDCGVAPQVAACYHHAMAYRDGALVYLHRAIRRVPADHELVRESCIAALRHCTASVYHGTAKLPAWPYFIASCNVQGQDRLFAAQVFQWIILVNSQHASTVKYMWSTIVSVWKTLDAAALADEGEDSDNEIADPFTLWKEIGRGMGLMMFMA